LKATTEDTGASSPVTNTAAELPAPFMLDDVLLPPPQLASASVISVINPQIN
jgi:hypothetical protein